MNLLFPENDDDGDENAINGDSGDDASSDGMNDDIESNAELTPGNTTDEEYERKYIFKSTLIRTNLQLLSNDWNFGRFNLNVILNLQRV